MVLGAARRRQRHSGRCTDARDKIGAAETQDGMPSEKGTLKSGTGNSGSALGSGAGKSKQPIRMKEHRASGEFKAVTSSGKISRAVNKELRGSPIGTSLTGRAVGGGIDLGRTG